MTIPLQLHKMEESSGDLKPPHDLEAIVQCLSTDDSVRPAELSAVQVTIEACLGKPGCMAHFVYI